MSAENCSNHKIFESLESSLDRLEEAAWFIRLMEEYYHKSDRFRWSLNSFLRAIKEVVQLVTMEVQQQKEIAEWFKSEKEQLLKEPLISYIFKQRDIVVHRSMLKPASRGTVGFTRGRGIKLGIGMPIDPLSDSVEAIRRYIYAAAKKDDFLGILYTEDDGSGEFTCVQRQWRLEQFPDVELTALSARAWERVATFTLAVAERLGAKTIEPKFELENPNHVQIEIYEPEWVSEQLRIMKEHVADQT